MSQVQILDEVISASLHANASKKDINLSVILPAMGKY